jgi:hypothetical protein
MTHATHVPPEAWSRAAPLDDYLREVVMNLHQATDRGIRNVRERPAEAARTLQACQDIIQDIMAGDVQDWVGD